MYQKLSLSILLFVQMCAPTGVPLYLQSGTWAETVLASMSLREKIGQLFVVAATSDFEQPTEILATLLQQSPYCMDFAYVEKMITQYGVGGVLFLFNSTPAVQIERSEQWQRMAKVPLLIAQDCEWGLSMRVVQRPML